MGTAEVLQFYFVRADFIELKAGIFFLLNYREKGKLSGKENVEAVFIRNNMGRFLGGPLQDV